MCLFTIAINYFGHVVRAGHLQVARKTCDNVRSLMYPTNASNMQYDLDMRNGLRSAVPKFARISASLDEKLEEGKSTALAQMTEEEKQAVDVSIEMLMSPPLLAFPRGKRKLTFETNACDERPDALVSRKQGKEPVKPIGYHCCSLNQAERSYTTTGRECFRIGAFLQLLRP